MPISPPSVRSYSLTSPTATSLISHALDALRPHLPTSLPLYRRLQFGRFFDNASCLLTNVQLTEKDTTTTNTSEDEQRPWLIAFVDRSCRPETEVWLFGSWESKPPRVTDYEGWKDVDRLVLALVKTVKNLPVPTSIHQDVLDAQAATIENDDKRDAIGKSRNDYSSHAHNPDIVLWGAIHEQTAPIFQRLNVLSEQDHDVPNHTFVFDVASLPPPRPLPEGLRWGDMTPGHLALVRSRTQIPRQDRTLAILPSLAIYPTSSSDAASSVAPIAWAFIGLDASLSTLHVEPEWRGKGLAKAITTKLFEDKLSKFWEDGLEQIAHGYVTVGNKASEGMMRSLGGTSHWVCYWSRVDVSKA